MQVKSAAATDVRQQMRQVRQAQRSQPSLAAVSSGIAVPLRGSSLDLALDVLGDWWTQRILRESFLGTRNFDVFHRHLAIPRQTLSDRLKRLDRHGVLVPEDGAWRLTPRGLALYPWALMIWRWTSRFAGSGGPRHPARLVHADCGRVTRPLLACAACRREVAPGDVEARADPAAASVRLAASHPRNDRRWSADRHVMGAAVARHNVAFVTADRWAHLILGAVLLGGRSFDAMQRAIGIASNILSQRLKLLVDAGFLDKTRSTDDARRFVYRLTAPGRDVFALTILLVQWAERWLAPRRTPLVLRSHRPCGRPLVAVVTCSACGEELLPRRVSFDRLPEPATQAC